MTGNLLVLLSTLRSPSSVVKLVRKDYMTFELGMCCVGLPNVILTIFPSPAAKELPEQFSREKLARFLHQLTGKDHLYTPSGQW